MKRLFSSVCAVAVLMALPALGSPVRISAQQIAERNEGQPQERRGGPEGGNRGQGQERGNQGQQNGRPPAQERGNQGQQGRGAPNRAVQGRARPQQQVGGNPAPQAGRAGLAERASNRGGGRVAGPVEHGPARFEKRAFQRNVTATRRFRVAAFRAPSGWQYRRWTFGQTLPVAFWAQPYWITNFWVYDLDRPPLGTEWVRNGPDALLVDTNTGEILEVVHNLFY